MIHCKHCEVREDWKPIEGSISQEIVGRDKAPQFCELADVFEVSLNVFQLGKLVFYAMKELSSPKWRL